VTTKRSLCLSAAAIGIAGCLTCLPARWPTAVAIDNDAVSGVVSGSKGPEVGNLSPNLVDLLAGSPAPGQHALAQPISPPDAIGKVKKADGQATAIRNGVFVALNVGDAVYKNDVIQTGGDSSVGIYFLDGSVLNLLANTRIALNDYSFDPNETSNGTLFSLVEGTFGFVAGKVARTGDMKLATPVAIGIRGPRRLEQIPNPR